MTMTRERCASCGWDGTDEAKEHCGASSMKGPGLCPSCGGDEFEEDKDEAR